MTVGRDAGPPRPRGRLDSVFVALFLVAWGLAAISAVGWPVLAGSLALELRQLFALAAGLGWLAGNVFVARRRSFPAALARRVFLIHFVGPAGLVFLLRAMAPRAEQVAAPLVGVLGFGVYGVFFLVPWSFRSRAARRPSGL